MKKFFIILILCISLISCGRPSDYMDDETKYNVTVTFRDTGDTYSSYKLLKKNIKYNAYMDFIQSNVTLITPEGTKVFPIMKYNITITNPKGEFVRQY